MAYLLRRSYQTLWFYKINLRRTLRWALPILISCFITGFAHADRFAASFTLVNSAGLSYATLSSNPTDSPSSESASKRCASNLSLAKTNSNLGCIQANSLIDFTGVDGYEVVVSIEYLGGEESSLSAQLRSDLQNTMLLSRSDVDTVELIYP